MQGHAESAPWQHAPTASDNQPSASWQELLGTSCRTKDKPCIVLGGMARMHGCRMLLSQRVECCHAGMDGTAVAASYRAGGGWLPPESWGLDVPHGGPVTWCQNRWTAYEYGAGTVKRDNVILVGEASLLLPASVRAPNGYNLNVNIQLSFAMSCVASSVVCPVDLLHNSACDFD
jgi:hypothetical protein